MLIEQAFSSYFITIIHANFYLFLFLKSVVSIFFKLLKSKNICSETGRRGRESVNNHGHLTKHLFTEVNRSIILLYLFCHRQDLLVLKSKIKYTLATAPNQIFLQKKAGRVKLKVHTMHDGQLRVSSVVRRQVSRDFGDKYFWFTIAFYITVE